jgi:hypothetical protein
MILIFTNEIIYQNKIINLLQINYGNYVLQKALTIANPVIKLKLINEILVNIEKLNNKNLIIKWKHLCDEHIRCIVNNFKEDF